MANVTEPTAPVVDAAGSRALSGRQIAHAAGLLIVGFIVSRVLGLVREAVLARLYGGGAQFEAYLAAARPPDTLFYIIAGGALGSAFIPTLTAYLLDDDRQEEAWRMASSVVTALAVLMAVLAALAAIFARPIVAYVLAPDFPAEKQALTVSLMQIMMLSPVIFTVSGLLMAVLNAHQRFLLPAIAPAMYNLGIIFGALVLTPYIGVYGLAWGVVIGALLHLVVQVPGMAAVKARYRPRIDLHDKGMREVARLMGPRVLGLTVVQINFWVNTRLASGMIEGSLAALSRGWTLFLLPQGIIAQSVANAVFPTFAVHVARGEGDQLRSTLGQVLRSVLFLSLPATLGMIVLRLPIVRLIYEYGAFTFADSEATAWALLFYALGLVAHSLVEIVTRAFYALHDTRTPVIIGATAMVLNVAFSLAFIRVIGQPESLTRGPFAGLALANTLATTIEGVALLAAIRPRVGGFEGRRLAISLARAGAASAAMGLALWALLPVLAGLGQLLGPLVGIAAGGAIFWAAAWLLGSEEARLFSAFALRRLRRA